MHTSDEFLYLLRKWENSSARVTGVWKYAGSERPSTSLYSSLEGTILLNEDSHWVMVSREGGGSMIVGFKDAGLLMGTGDDIPISSPDFLLGIDEFVDIQHSSGLRIRLYTVLPKSVHHDPTM
jgi:hypothetical protein